MRILFMIRKEFIQLVRDPRTLLLVFIFPVAMLLLFGYAISLDIKDVPLAIVDYSKSAQSRELIDDFLNCNYFTAYYTDRFGAETLLDEGDAKMALVIPVDYAARIGAARPASVQLLVDGSDNNTASIALGYAETVIQLKGINAVIEPVINSGMIDIEQIPPIDLIPRFRFNPELSSTVFIVPGLVAMIMMMTVVVMSALSIVKEKELGTLETIMVSPMSGFEVILGKLVPYLILGFADLYIILISGHIFFDVPFRGSVLLLTFLSFIFITGGLGMGLFISTLVQTQQVAWMVSLITTMLPSILLSGFIFPIRCMPVFLQYITYLLPVRYYLTIVRSVVLKGSGIQSLWLETAAMAVFATLMITLSGFMFRKQIG